MNRRKENANKGFSLVELIIVVAIMAVLIGVLAPQYLKYVERSRQSTDKQNVDAIINAVRIYAIDPEVAADDQIETNAVIKLTTTSTAVSDTNASKNTDEALKAAGITNLVLKSSKWTDSKIDLTFTLDANGNISVTASDPNILK